MIERTRKKWVLSLDGGVTFDTVVSPLNTQSIKFAWMRDLKAGQIFFRCKLTTALRFGKPDFDLFYNLERTPVRRCNDLYIRQLRLCEGQWIKWWTGRFSVGSGKYYMDACQVEYKPDVFDRYTCFVEKFDTKINVLDLSPVTIEAQFLLPFPFGVDYERARLLLDVFTYLLDQTGCEYDQVVSDFFEWNPVGDAPGYVAGNNYVTGLTNQLSLLYIFQKSDTIGTTASPHGTNPATIGEMTLKEFFEYMRKLLNVFWDIDDDGNFRLEHWKYWNFPEGLDITAGENFELNRGENTFEHLSKEMPVRERFKFMDGSSLTDFPGVDIIYDTLCILRDDRETIEETSLPISTDIVWLVSNNPTEPSPTGWTLMATAPNPPNPDRVINDLGALSGTNWPNMPLSWANLHRDYFTWNRYQKKGNMNGADVIFDSFIPNIQQPDLKVRFCCGMEGWDPKDTVATELGERFLNGRNGHLEKAELEDFDDRLTITLRYAY